MIRCRYSECPHEATSIVDHESMGMLFVCDEHVSKPNQVFRRLRNKFLPRNRYRLMCGN